MACPAQGLIRNVRWPCPCGGHQTFSLVLAGAATCLDQPCPCGDWNAQVMRGRLQPDNFRRNAPDCVRGAATVVWLICLVRGRQDAAAWKADTQSWPRKMGSVFKSVGLIIRRMRS